MIGKEMEDPVDKGPGGKLLITFGDRGGHYPANNASDFLLQEDDGV